MIRRTHITTAYHGQMTRAQPPTKAHGRVLGKVELQQRKKDDSIVQVSDNNRSGQDIRVEVFFVIFWFLFQAGVATRDLHGHRDVELQWHSDHGALAGRFSVIISTALRAGIHGRSRVAECQSDVVSNVGEGR